MDLSAIRRIFEKITSGTLYAGFSGGADSTALLLLAQRFQKDCGYRLCALHFEHGFRGGESCCEAEAAASFAMERGIPFLRIDLHLLPGPDAENRAREARLAEYARISEQEPDCVFALGHHGDDRAENLLLRLCRGSNVSGLTGLREDVRLGKVRLLRPLLSVSREEIEAFLREEGIRTWNTDSSNSDCRYCRNKLRNRILPELYAGLPGSREGLRRAARVLAEDADFLERSAEIAWKQVQGGPSERWRDLHSALIPRVLRIGFRERCGAELIPPADAVEAFQKLLAGNRAGAVCFSEHCAVSTAKGEVRFYDPSAVIAPEEPLLWNWREIPVICWGGWKFSAESGSCNVPCADLNEACFDPALFPAQVLLRGYQPGDSMVPFGRTAPEKLKKLRIDRGVSSVSAPPLLVTPDGVICWAPGVRHGNFAPVREAGEMLHFQMQPMD